MKPWQQIGETENVYDGWRKVYKKVFLTNSGKEFVAEINGADDAAEAVVIALTPENRVVIARQFRVGPGKIMDEIPGGYVEPGEDPQETVLRELREETGYEAGRIMKIGQVHKGAYIATVRHCYLAEDCRRVSKVLDLDEEEEIEVDTISIAKLFANAQASRMTDTEALFFAYEKLKELEEM